LNISRQRREYLVVVVVVGGGSVCCGVYALPNAMIRVKHRRIIILSPYYSLVLKKKSGRTKNKFCDDYAYQ
jgi:threonine dehydratase